MKKHYEALILSAILAGTILTGCDTSGAADLPAAENPVTEAAAGVTETEKVTEAITEEVTEPVTEETKPAVTEAKSARETNLESTDWSSEITFGEFGDYGGTHTFSELYKEGKANVSADTEGLAMAFCKVGNAAGSCYYEPAYTTDFGKTWKGALQSSDNLQIANGTVQFFPADNGDIIVFLFAGPVMDPEILIIRQSESSPKPVISRNVMELNEFAPEDGWNIFDEAFKASYDGGTVLHVDYFRKDTGELVSGFDADFGDFDFTFSE